MGDKRFTRFHVTNRIKQMNKRLDAILGQRVAEKRGKCWALTSFMHSAWDSTKEELDVRAKVNTKNLKEICITAIEISTSVRPVIARCD